MKLDRLSGLLRACPYPEQMEHMECGILGSGFYPGARGFHHEQSPQGGIMLLGRDFGTKTYYARLCGEPARNETASTWQRTRDIYLAGFQEAPVWCTNYLLGVRRNGSAVGNIRKQMKPSEWISFEAYCWQFMQAQVLLQRPRLVVVLGADNRHDLLREERLGLALSKDLRHVFEYEEEKHAVLVAFADHPHSFISRPRRETARKIAEQLKQRYQSEL
jgi:hypothetical protein